MEPVKVCRVCLIMDVKMFDLHSYPLATFFEPILNNIANYISYVYNSMDMPTTVCYECASYIQKYYHFWVKCLKGETTLHNIMKANGMITEDSIKEFDRRTLNLVSNLSVSHQDDQAQYIINNDAAIQVKEELPNDIESVTSLNIETDSIKDEDFGDSPLPGMSSDDNEPLIMQKSKKEKRKRKGKKKLDPDVDIASLKQQLIEENTCLLWSKQPKEENSSLEVIEVQNEVDIKKPIEDYTTEFIRPRKSVSLKEKKKRNGRKKLDVVLNLLDLEEQPKEDPGLLAMEVQEQADDSEPTEEYKTRRVKPVPQKPEPRKSRDVIDDQDIEEYCTVIKLTLDEQIAEINDRKNTTNFKNALYQCDLCYKGFLETHTWENHKKKHEPSAGDLQCEVCKFRFRTKRVFKKHVSVHEWKYSCKSCKYVSKTSTQAKQHQRWHKGYTYQCPFCDEVSTKWTSHLSHVRIKHPSQFVCGICGYSFVSQLGLTMHKTMMHKDVASEMDEGSGARPHCAECDVTFLSEEAFKRHLAMSAKHVQDNDTIGCRLCGERFASADLLRVHNRHEHAKKRPKNYGKKATILKWPIKCEHCSEEIANARSYWSHFRRVHPDKNYPIQKDYVCDICGKSFRGNAFLVYHKRTHTDERAFKCGTCGKAFHNRTNLYTHMKIHLEERPYPCDLCYKAFRNKGALDRHNRSHTGEKPYECEVCGKSFGQSNSRKLHVRTVHLKQPAPYISKSRLMKKNQAKEESVKQFVMF